MDKLLTKITDFIFYKVLTLWYPLFLLLTTLVLLPLVFVIEGVKAAFEASKDINYKTFEHLRGKNERKRG